MADGGGAIIVKNLQEVLAAIGASQTKIENGAKIGIAQAGLAIERQAKLNANTGTRLSLIHISEPTRQIH
jgi:hypothetical protein